MRKMCVIGLLKQTILAMSTTLLLSMAIVTQAPAKNLTRIATPQEKIVVTGTVSDKTGTLPGVTVMEKGTTNGTATDIDGKFTLNVQPGAVLQCSFVGYKPQDVTVGNQKTFNIILEEDNQQLEELVVVGYGTQKKVNLTGSVASIGSDDLKERVNTNVLNAVQGSVPGVTVISRPGQAPSINFRGRGNLGTSEPLYVIDGAIADASFFSSLDPNSIESISFLKDAASSAIYGSRAAYGVVLVKTKGGKTGDMTITYNGYVGVKMPTYIPDLVNSAQYAKLKNEAAKNKNANAGDYAIYSQEEIQKFRDGSDRDMYANTNWFDEVLDKAVMTTQHSINFSGGTDKLRYYTGLGYVYDDKFMPGQDENRFNLTSSLSADVKKWLTLNTNIKFIYNKNERTKGSPWMANFLIVPVTFAAKQSNGEWGSYAGGVRATQTALTSNPLRELEEGGWGESHTKNGMIDLGLDIKPVKGLVLTGQFVYKGYNYQNKSFTATKPKIKDFKTGQDIDGTDVQENKMTMDWVSTSRLLYNGLARYDWSNGTHNVNVLAGMSYEHYKYNRMYGSRKNFPINGMEDVDAGSKAPNDIYFGSSDDNSGGVRENKMLSYFGRVNYSYNDKYLVEANLRADASSRFYKKERWGIFPSFSAGWRINQEEFLKDIHWINNLKIRASWGTLGNINNVGDYDYIPSYTTGNDYNFDDVAVGGILEAKPANKTLSWETVKITDFGVDFDIFNGKLNLIADYYIKNTEDILLAYNVAPETGIMDSPSQNLGKVQNKGIELALNHRSKIGQVTYAVGFNMAYNWNKVKDLGESDPMITNGGDKIRYIKKVGKPIGTYYGYKTNGLYTQEEIDAGKYIVYGRKPNAGDIKYVDRDHSEDISAEDRTYLGKDVPDMTYGINLNIQYKGFELSAFGQGVTGTSVAFESEQVHAFFLNATPRKFHLKRWTPENPNRHAPVPRIYDGSQDDYNRKEFSDYQVFNADYFRLKNLTLGYTFPKSMVEKCGLSVLKVFVTAENVCTIRGDKKMKDFDPEAASGRGLGALGTRSVALGINLSF